jgi:hypothetical protein
MRARARRSVRRAASHIPALKGAQMIRVDPISAVPRENWFAGCMASVDIALSRNGVAFSPTAGLDDRGCLIPGVSPTHPLALALTEYRQGIQRDALGDLRTHLPTNSTSTQFRSQI